MTKRSATHTEHRYAGDRPCCDPHSKVVYDSKQVAERAAANISNQSQVHFWAYGADCGWWHVKASAKDSRKMMRLYRNRREEAKRVSREQLRQRNNRYRVLGVRGFPNIDQLLDRVDELAARKPYVRGRSPLTSSQASNRIKTQREETPGGQSTTR